MSLLMPHGFRDIILVACALICAVAAIYIVYNIEIFRHRGIAPVDVELGKEALPALSD
jgi:hypothetical protein